MKDLQNQKLNLYMQKKIWILQPDYNGLHRVETVISVLKSYKGANIKNNIKKNTKNTLQKLKSIVYLVLKVS